MTLEKELEKFVEVIESHRTVETFRTLYDTMYQDLLVKHPEVEEHDMHMKVLLKQMEYHGIKPCIYREFKGFVQERQ